MSARFLRGPRRWLVDLVLALRVLWVGSARLGPLGLARALWRYLRDNRNIVSGSADRYVLLDGAVYAATAMPPVNSRRFVDVLLDEVTTFNERRPAPMIFALLSVSSRCPYRCRHCYALKQLSDREHVDVDSIRRAILGLASRGVRNVFLTGGEPLFRASELPALLEATADHVDAFWLVTTGWNLKRVTLVPLLEHKLRGVVISLDSSDPGEVARAKGHPHAHAHATAAIAVALDLGLLVSVDCMVTPRLLDRRRFLAYMQYLRDLGVHFVNLFPPHRSGGVEKYDLSTLDAAQLDLLESLVDEANTGAAHADWPIAYSAVVWERRRGCAAGQRFLYVDPRGDVRPCPFLDLPAGNIASTPIEDVIDRMREVGEQGGCYGQYHGVAVGRRTGSTAEAVRAPQD